MVGVERRSLTPGFIRKAVSSGTEGGPTPSWGRVVGWTWFTLPLVFSKCNDVLPVFLSGTSCPRPFAGAWSWRVGRL